MMQKVFRNYTYDRPAIFRDIYIALCDGFDELQLDEFQGVDKQEMIKYIMRKTKGAANPMQIEMILKEFEEK